jgi:hypothetical protein
MGLQNRTCGISMPGHVECALEQFKHPSPKWPQHSLHHWTEPHCGTEAQVAETQGTNCVDMADTQRAQEALGCCLCCARAADCAVPPAIGTLATQQAKPMITTFKGLTQLLNCAATHLDAKMRFRASDMALRIDGGASCLSESKTRS